MNSYQNLENTNIERLSAKVVNNQFDRSHCDDLLQNVLFIHRFILQGSDVSAETQLG